MQVYSLLNSDLYFLYFRDYRIYNRGSMGYMNFKSPALEQLFKNFKWTRNNTIEIFEAAVKQDILGFRSSSKKPSKHTFQPVIFQFQCIVTTTDAYYRKLTNAKNQSYGVYVKDEEVIPKANIKVEEIGKILLEQLRTLEILLRDFDNKKTEKLIDKVQAFSNHEYLHQGELILMFREAGAELPERYVKSWAL